MREDTARVAKLGQRRKIQGLILSGSGVQIPSLAPVFILTLLFSIFCKCIYDYYLTFISLKLGKLLIYPLG